MKNIITKLYITLALALVFVPSQLHADTGDYGYGSSDFYDYGSSYGSSDFYAYGSSYDYGSSDFYDYSNDYSYGSSDFYDYDSYYNYGSSDFYDYDSSYGSSDFYDYDNNYSYGSSDFYDYDSYYNNTPISYATGYDNYYDSGYDNYYINDDFGFWGDDILYTSGGCLGGCLGGSTREIVYVNNNTNTNTSNLSVQCIVSDRTIEEGDSVTFDAEVTGGNSPFTYRWTGDFTSNNRSVTVRFDDSGTYSGTIKVTDSRGRTATANCATVQVRDTNDSDDDFDVVCKVSDTSIKEGDDVRFTAEVDGGDSPFRYDWSGDVDSNKRSFTETFDDSGRYEVQVKVTDDDGRVARDTCSVVRVSNDNDDDDDRDINVTSGGNLSSGTGTFASVGSVYLNQVPYTGPEDIAKGVAFVGILLGWSTLVALSIRKKMKKNEIAKRISEFKEKNKLAKI